MNLKSSVDENVCQYNSEMQCKALYSQQPVIKWTVAKWNEEVLTVNSFWACLELGSVSENTSTKPTTSAVYNKSSLRYNSYAVQVELHHPFVVEWDIVEVSNRK